MNMFSVVYLVSVTFNASNLKSLHMTTRGGVKLCGPYHRFNAGPPRRSALAFQGVAL